MFKNFFKEAATTGKLRIPSVHATDEIPLIAGEDVAGAAATVMLDFDAYARQVLIVLELGIYNIVIPGCYVITCSLHTSHLGCALPCTPVLRPRATHYPASHTLQG